MPKLTKVQFAELVRSMPGADEATVLKAAQSKEDSTELGPDDEQKFQQWVKASDIKDADAPDAFYDYRGLFKENGTPVPTSAGRHFPDTYKKHGHPTFSRESKYSRGEGDGGTWDGDKFVPAEKLPPDQPQSLSDKIASSWEAARTPLTDLPSRAAKAAGDFIDQRSLSESKPAAMLKGFTAGALQGAGDMVSQLTSPLDLALSLVGLGGAKAGAKGLLGISKAARVAEGALQVPYAAEGALNTVEGIKEGDYGKAGAGVLEAGMAGVGLHSAAKHSFPVQKVAEAYAKEAGLPKPVPHTPVEVNPNVAKRIADAYEDMPHAPNDPAVQASYSALGKETSDQFKFMTERAGLKAEPWTNEGQPYANSQEMMKDIQDNNHLFYFPSDLGFGEKPNIPGVQVALPNAGNPLLQPGASGKPINDEFRAIHDYFGHAKQGFQFGPKGEENAWVAHSGMFTPEAKPAMTTETRGQNSWVNSGRHLRREDGVLPKKGEPGFVAPADRPFAEQKTGLLPAEFQSREGAAQSVQAAPAPVVQQLESQSPSTSTSPNSALSGVETAANASAQGSPVDFAKTIADLHNENEGSTFNLQKGSLSGTPSYAVSIYKGRETVIPGAKLSPEIVNAFAEKNADLLKDPGNSIGTWFNKDDGKTYLDISRTTDNLDEAVQAAKDNNQLAIFDLGKFEEIPVMKAKPEAATQPGKFSGSTALAFASPAAAMAIPDDPDSKWDDYGRLGLGIASLGALGATVRTKALEGPKLHATRAAGMMLAGLPKATIVQRLAESGVGPQDMPIVHATAAKMLAKEVEKAGAKLTTTKKLLAHFDAGKPEMGWYDDTNKELQDIFGKDSEKMAGFLTATSVNSTVKSNVTLALKAYSQFKAGVPFQGYLPAVIKELDRVAQDQPLSGRKLDNFRKAILGDPDAVVIDRWMLRAFGYNVDAATPHTYDLLENAVKELASKAGVTPRQMQAAVWFGVKNKAEEGMGRPQSPPFQTILRDKMASQKAQPSPVPPQ